jgi:bifunctional non-homologous end joining protein LigD
VADFAVMETPDGNWRVEVYRPRGAPTFWYRLVNVPGENVIEGLTIGSVQRLLAEAGVDLADLVEAA